MKDTKDIEPTFQDVTDAGIFPTPEEYKKMIWMLRWCRERTLVALLGEDAPQDDIDEELSAKYDLTIPQGVEGFRVADKAWRQHIQNKLKGTS